MSEVDGATLIARSLKQQGIDHLFGIVGFPITAIAAAAQKEGIAYLGMRNEQSAAYAAGAYGYLTGRPGACVVVTGPGVVHSLAGLANAQQNCWPMILVRGAGATYLDMPDDIIRAKCDLDKVVDVERVGEPPRMVAPMENVEAALNLL